MLLLHAHFDYGKAALLALLAVLFLPVFIDLIGSQLLRLHLRRDAGGDSARGLVIFVESIRWLGLRWGVRSVAAGLRRAGFEGEFLYWRWHESWRGWLVLPAIMSRNLLETQAQRLAEYICAQRRAGPNRPIYLIGYSCGVYVAIRALELLPEDTAVDGAALLAPVVDPRRDLSTACVHLRGPMVCTCSWLDWFIVGLGTILFGTGDRKHTLSAGMRGFANLPGRVVQVRWSPGMILLGQLGGHFSASSSKFISRCVAPSMGIFKR